WNRLSSIAGIKIRLLEQKNEMEGYFLCNLHNDLKMVQITHIYITLIHTSLIDYLHLHFMRTYIIFDKTYINIYFRINGRLLILHLKVNNKNNLMYVNQLNYPLILPNMQHMLS